MVLLEGDANKAWPQDVTKAGEAVPIPFGSFTRAGIIPLGTYLCLRTIFHNQLGWTVLSGHRTRQSPTLQSACRMKRSSMLPTNCCWKESLTCNAPRPSMSLHLPFRLSPKVWSASPGRLETHHSLPSSTKNLVSVSVRHSPNFMKRVFCLSSETYRRSRRGLIDHTFQFGALFFPMDPIVDMTSLVPSVTEFMTGSTVPEIVNIKILGSAPISAWEPAVIPTGQSPHP